MNNSRTNFKMQRQTQSQIDFDKNRTKYPNLDPPEDK